jgi:hypothetical protein
MEDKWGYYTVITDYFATGEGHHRMILIVFTRNDKAALYEFGKMFGVFYTYGAEVKEGIDVEDYQDLLTEHAKKVIIKIKSGDKNAPPMFGYSNSTYVNYS